MSNIIKSEEDVKKLRECLELFRRDGMNADSLNIVANHLMPRNNCGLLVDYKIKDQGLRTAQFIPRYNRIDFAVDKCEEWLNTNVDSIAEYYGISDKEELRAYLSLLLPMHEVEHSYQYLMGNDSVSCPYLVVRNSYRTLTELMIKPNNVLPHPIRDVRRAISLVQYFKKQDFYLLERNAQLEAYGVLLILALREGHQEMIEAFNDMTKSYVYMGYDKDRMGCMYHTFKDLLMMDYYKRLNYGENIKPNDALRYGLEISEEAREDLLSKVKRRTK